MNGEERRDARVDPAELHHDQARADRGGPEVPQFPPGSPFEQFFRDFLERNRPGPRGPAPDRPERGPGGRASSLGSGVIIDAAGYIVTNNHVVGRADRITVSLADGTEMQARLIGTDELTDIAVISPAFSADCIETLEEINGEIREAFEHAGGQQFTYVPCLNDDDAHIAVLTAVIAENMAGWA